MARQDIEKLNERFYAALIAGDLETLMDCYDEEVVFQMPGVPTIIGRSGVKEHYKNVFAIGVSQAKAVTESFTELADCDVEAGCYEMTLTPVGSDPVTDKGKFQIVYRQTGGKWYIWYDMVLSDSAPPIAAL